MKTKQTSNQLDNTSKKETCHSTAAWCRCQLLLQQPFIGSLALQLAIVPVCDDSRLETAATDGSSIFLDCDFFRSLLPKEQIFVIAHEVWHVAFRHFLRQQKREQERWNVAADLEIQFAIEDADYMTSPWQLPFSPEWRGLSAEEIYELLPPDAQRPDNADKHLSPGSCGKEDAEDIEDPILESDYQPQFSKDIGEKLQDMLLRVSQQVERNHGDIPSTIRQIIKNICDPKLSWQTLLARYLTQHYYGQYRWFPPARRHLWRKLYLPSLRGQRLNAVLAIDTSGSTVDDLPLFMGELKSLFSTFGNFEITVIHCDAEIQKVEKYCDFVPDSDTLSEFMGGGGTDFRPVFKYLEDHPEIVPDVLLYFTDGDGSAPDKPPAFPVLWVLTPESESPARWGQSITMQNCSEEERSGIRPVTIFPLKKEFA
ncbi:MAG: VWA-like domain-containing protein [Lentisphaeria bacterium]